MRTQLAAACTGLALIAATATTTAQPVWRKFLNQENKVGKVEFFSSNYGMFGLDVARGNSGFTYPRGSGKAYIFGAGLWFGARKMVDGSLRPLTFITCNPNSGASWAVPSEYYADSLGTRPSMYNSEEFNRSTGEHMPGTEPAWPLWLASGTSATPMQPGLFEPDVHQRNTQGLHSAPAFIPGADEQIVSRFDDRDLDVYERRDSTRLGFPLGLEIQQNTLGWADGLYAPVVLIQYQIVNTSSDTLHDCVAAQVSDPEIGMPDNDRTRYYAERPELRAAYVWDDLAMSQFGALGMTIIEAPMTDANGFVDMNNRMSYRTEGRVGAFPDWIIETDPSISGQRYEFMTTGTKADGSNAIGDKRTLLGSTTFSMHPGDTAYFTVAYVVLDSIPSTTKTTGKGGGRHATRVPDGAAAMSQFENIITRLLDDYYINGSFASVPASAPEAPAAETGMSMSAAPNPAGDHTTIRMTLAGRGNATLRITNTLGETVMRRDLGNRGAGTYEENVDAATLPAGLYFALVEEGGRTGTIRFAVTR